MINHVTTLYNDEKTKDTIIEFFYPNKDKRFKREVHIIIMTQAAYFRTTYVGHWAKKLCNENNKNLIFVELEDEMEEKYIDSFIQIIYGIMPENIIHNCIYVHSICDYFGYSYGSNLCEKCMEDNINSETVIPLILYAKKANLINIETICTQYCKAFAFTNIKYDELSKLPLDMLLNLIIAEDTVILESEKTALMNSFFELNNGINIEDILYAYDRITNVIPVIRTLFTFCLDKESIGRIKGRAEQKKFTANGRVNIEASMSYIVNCDPQLWFDIRFEDYPMIVCSEENSMYTLNIYAITKTKTLKDSIYLTLSKKVEKIGPMPIRIDDILTENCHTLLPVIIEIASYNNGMS
jgi:hypothetical protein